MKILHVMPSYIPAYRYGGPVKTVHELCRALVECGQEVSVFTTNANQKKRLDVPLNKEQNVEGVKVTYHPLGLMSNYYYSRDLAKAIEARVSDFDIVHIHSVFLYTTFIAAYWCRRKNIPYIINPFGALDPDMIKLKNTLIKKFYIATIEKKNIEKAAAVHVASLYEKERFLSLGIDVPVVVVPRGLYLDEYRGDTQRASLAERYPQLKGKRVILFLGRIHFKKGLELLAAALKRVVEKRRDIYLVIAGPGERGYTDKLRKLFRKMGLADYVVFTGMLLGDDKLSAFYSSDIFVLTSYGENFGIAVLEAMACKLPVVITDRVGIYKDAQEYKTGIVTGCDPGQIAEGLLKLLKDKSLRKLSGENGRRLVEEKFTWDKAARAMVEAYSEYKLSRKE